MIEQQKNAYLLHTEHTTYFLRIDELGKPVLEYYGKRLKEGLAHEGAYTQDGPTGGRTIVYNDALSKTASLNDKQLEFSTPWKGDNKCPSLLLKNEDSCVFDFTFVEGTVQPISSMKDYPTPHDGDQELVLRFEDKAMNVSLDLHYLVFEKANVIGRYVEVKNLGEKELTVQKIMSLQLDLLDRGYELVSYYGNWAGEFQKDSTPIRNFAYRTSSNTGSSADNRNPFFYIKKKDASYSHGDVYGFNFIYSGNHEETVERDSFGKIRILQGISSQGFEAKLGQNESFVTPISIVSYSCEGTNGLAHNMHSFVQNHVVPKHWAKLPRPILFNNWEGTYMKFNEAKIHSLAKKAQALGMELFVLDDGWFGHRDTDTTSLGDWFVYKKKLPHEIKGLSDYVHKLGMKFGLWFEPEMISEDSELYKDHPDWTMKDPFHDFSKGRTQMVLDLTKPEVVDYLYERLSTNIKEGGIDYIKWDYNRTFSDLPSSDGLYCHRYILALYGLLARLREAFPEILLENCASGGGRNDLGMFSYFDQAWVSDDTDSFERAKIQLGMAMGYPPSVMGNHVASKVSHQMLRRTSYGTKFDIACIGLLGYELNIADLDSVGTKEVKAEVEFYKAHREVCQFGIYDVLETFDDGNHLIVEMHNDKEAVVSFTNFLQTPHPGVTTLPLTGLDEEAEYEYSVRPEGINLLNFGAMLNHVSPVHIKEDGNLASFAAHVYELPIEKFSGVAHGSLLNGNGLKLGPEWAGTGIADNVRILRDFGARLYLFTKKEN